MNLTKKQIETLVITFNSAFVHWSAKIEKAEAEKESQEYLDAVNEIYNDIWDLQQTVNDQINIQ